MIQLARACLAAVLLVGCAEANVMVRIPVDAPIERVSMKLSEARGARLMTLQQRSVLETTLSSALARSGVMVVSPVESDAPVLEGQIEVYDPGSRVLRSLFGSYGAGYFDSTWVVRSPAGAMIGACHVDASVRGGPWGGSFDAALEEAGTRLAEFLLAQEP